MRKYPTLLHCYVRPERNYYLAVCLELNLCDRGKTLEEAKASLEEDIAGYLESLTPEDLPRLFPRYAPLYTYVDYYKVCLILFLGKLTHHLRHRWTVFFEPLLLKPQLLHG